VGDVLLGDVLWAATQLAPKSNTDNMVALAFMMSKSSGELFLIMVSLDSQRNRWNPVLSLSWWEASGRAILPN
jgi:hypothetical protein